MTHWMPVSRRVYRNQVLMIIVAALALGLLSSSTWAQHEGKDL